MNSKAHDDCEQWIINKFKGYGMSVVPQKCDLKGYDGTILHSTNIIASYKPELKDRILLCAHWDCRPWADNDPDEANWKKPVMAANDAASGVAVMLEIARLLSPDSCRLSPTLGIDFICFDAEDYGFPQWETIDDPGNTWALGAQYWAAHPHTAGYKARYGILFDMVGGQGAQFYQEVMSKYYAKHIVDKVWQAATVVGYGSSFPMSEGTGVTDDHIPVNTTANIPCIDIIPYFPTCEQSSFGPTWHTLNDDMAHLDKNTLQAVGQTVIQVLFSE
jgi:Zn-dependent M28 family amino/carboxypeptidase